ncbi:PH domain-containing protein [Frigoriflavimonas asaccharolytica]|uniref:Uncharacterized protein YyaB-like PH domain-containing protein n=1 Tax=Frigoriflavimonas asaccharolytica TaxID=2735899 RepID=A0A8J8G5X1_9FLAO|nr:PH domain-containing protein [Frigoriflavimonas asaccharolytica]NRS91626.1 hypothetical protein [Frigoriflavimonas asaccharolytica]
MEEIIFKTKKIDKVFFMLYLGIILLLLSISWYTYLEKDDFFVFLPMGLIIISLLFLSFGGRYFFKIIVKENKLTIRFLFNIYTTEIEKITKIRKGETMWSGFHKYGTGTKGLIIFAKYHNDLYITPENELLFIETLQKINPQIIFENIENN